MLVGIACVLASAAAAPSAARGEFMYRLSVRFVGTENKGELHRTTTYVAQSVKAFPLTRTPSSGGPVYRFEAQVSGTLGHSGGETSGSGASGERCTEAAMRPVSGRVAVVPLVGARQNPAPLHIAVKPTPPTAIETCISENGEKYEFTRYTLLPQAPRWNGMLEFVETKPVDLGRSFGKKFTVTYTEGYVASINGATRRNAWTLTFTPVRPPTATVRWQVDVKGTDTWEWGHTAAGPGVWVYVDWRHTTVLAVKGGKVVSATGKVRVLGTRWRSDPGGVFTVTAKTAERPAYPLRPPTLKGLTLTLNLNDEPRNRAGYRLDYTTALAGQDALERMRAAGVPEIVATAVQENFTKGPLVLHEVGIVPGSQRLVTALRPRAYVRTPESFNEKLPCRLFGSDDPKCFLIRGGETVTVAKLG